MTWVLASSSPRRKELLAQAGFTQAQFQFVQVSPDIDESQLALESPSDYVSRLALEKAQAGLELSRHLPQPKVIGSDTIVVLDGELLGKPTDPQDALRMLTSLSGRTHTVMTAVAITDGERALSRLCQTDVSFASISFTDIQQYIATGEPMDKAGAYGIQGLGGCFVSHISGSYTAVVGLPLVETRALLAAMMEQDDTP